MIHGIWNNINLKCGCHKEYIDLEIQQGPHSLFYACPKYHPENRDSNERACANRINLVDYENMIKHLSEILTNAEMNNEVIVLTGYKWVSKSIEYEIINHTKDKIDIVMVNKKALR